VSTEKAERPQNFPRLRGNGRIINYLAVKFSSLDASLSPAPLTAVTTT
jgi:hypothetical protein